MSGFRAKSIGNSSYLRSPILTSRIPLLSNLASRRAFFRNHSSILFAKKTTTAHHKIPRKDLTRAAAAFNPKKFQTEGAKKVAAYLKMCLRQGDLDGLKFPAVSRAVGKNEVQYFNAESGTKNYYTALAFHLPANIRQDVVTALRLSDPVALILEEGQTIRDLYGKKRPYPTKKKLNEVAMRIDPQIFGSKKDQTNIQVAQYIKDALADGNLQALMRRNLIWRFGNNRIETFSKIVVGNGSHFEAVAAFIPKKDMNVMRAILNACGYNKDMEAVLSRCGSFKGVVSKLQDAKGAATPEGKKKGRETERARLLSWAEGEIVKKTQDPIRFGIIAKKARSGKATEEELRTLRWGHAKIHYSQQEGSYNRLKRFCILFGGTYDQDGKGWYRALKSAYSLSEEQIEKIKGLVTESKSPVSHTLLDPKHLHPL